MLDVFSSSRSRPFHLLAACLFLGACSSSTVAGGSGGSGGSAGTLGLGCTRADDCDTGLCVIAEESSFCTQECDVDTDCPSAMFCAWIYAASTGRCDPLANANRECAEHCDYYHATGRASPEAVAACVQACGAVTAAQAGAFVTCAGKELSGASGTACMSAVCSQAGASCP